MALKSPQQTHRRASIAVWALTCVNPRSDDLLFVGPIVVLHVTSHSRLNRFPAVSQSG